MTYLVITWSANNSLLTAVCIIWKRKEKPKRRCLSNSSKDFEYTNWLASFWFWTFILSENIFSCVKVLKLLKFETDCHIKIIISAWSWWKEHHVQEQKLRLKSCNERYSHWFNIDFNSFPHHRISNAFFHALFLMFCPLSWGLKLKVWSHLSAFNVTEHQKLSPSH